jgi:protoheme IX farnesyltransferase
VTVAVGLDAAAVAEPRALRAVARDYISLTKPRIIVLLEVTAFAAMVMAARGWPGTWRVLVTLAGGALAAGGANTINMWFDRDIDRTMHRTCSRPIASGRIGASAALRFGIGLGVAGFVLLALLANVLAAVLATSALLFYVLVYTMYLKRSSIQNIVIGGAAGAVPPLVGWVAVTGRLDVPALFLFAVVFYWTPPHFWALSLLMQGDYTRAGVPMLPVVVGSRATRVHIVLWTLILLIVTVLPFLARTFGLLYLAGAVVLNGIFLMDALRLLGDPSPRSASRLFHYSLLYLALLFAVMAIDRVVIPG